MNRQLLLCFLAVGTLSLSGCWGPSSYEPETPPTVPVSGTVLVDGKPMPRIFVLLYPADNPTDVVDPITMTPSRGTTDDQGKFQITTFKANDGAPVGEYAVAFYWAGNPKPSLTANADEQPVDPAATKFNRKFGNAAKSVVNAVVVEEGKPVDLGTIELKTK